MTTRESRCESGLTILFITVEVIGTVITETIALLKTLLEQTLVLLTVLVAPAHRPVAAVGSRHGLLI